MPKITDPIGVFDSGVGGISVLRELVQRMPEERYIYFGDSANAPYGTRTLEDVAALAIGVADRFAARNVKALVVACNTATAAALEKIKTQYPELLVIGVEPCVGVAAARHPEGRIGVLATPATIRERKFMYQMEPYPQATVDLIPAPYLMEFVDAGKFDAPETDEYLKKLLGEYIGKLDALVLGCTHYPFVKKALRRVLGSGTELFDGSSLTAEETVAALTAAGLRNDKGPGSVQIENSLQDGAILELSAALLQE